MRGALNELSAQGQVLDNIQDTQEKIDSNVKKGGKIVNSMSSWGGYFKGVIKGFGGGKL